MSTTTEDLTFEQRLTRAEERMVGLLERQAELEAATEELLALARRRERVNAQKGDA